MALLEIRKLTKQFGGLVVLDGLDMDVREGEILGVIGPNGAGKTTLFSLITGFLKPTRGEILFQNENIAGLSPHTIAKKGIVRSFQLTGVFGTFTVLDNMRMGFHLRSRIGLFERFFNRAVAQRRKNDIDQSAIEILGLLGMDQMKDQLASDLSHGYHKSLTVAIPLAARPKLLLLDEPVALIDQERVAAMVDFIHKIRDRGVTVVIVEHNIKTLFGVCDRIVVIDHGMKLAEGLPQEIRNNKDVIAAYLGGKAGAA